MGSSLASHSSQNVLIWTEWPAMRANINEEMSAYLAEISKYKVLTREEEVELFRRLEAGDETAREEIVAANLRFVVKIALKYAGRGIPISDLVQEGNIGLLEVVDKFDYRRGYRFSTYAAFWIRQAIEVAVRKQCHMIRLPIRKSRLLGHVTEAVQNFVHAHGRQPTTRELALLLDVDEQKLAELLQVRDAVISLDAELSKSDDEPTGLYTILRDTRTVSPADQFAEREKAELVQKALATLSPRERSILKLRFGLGAREDNSLRATSKVVGLSQEGVRRIERRALSKLRRGKARELLASVA
ncbi:MAG: RNA polymerase sigma factor RpoD/SigA [Candidatus Hydrogenedentota bacterium]|jgi:RNA polymerase primary sigma factor|nr:MAG: RNA polymerase sigma factor RpoD/SigA [Candidatus Hydrogenedentota bacterium]